MSYLRVDSSLTTLYPDIEDELCNRHSTHLTKITHKFEHLYNKIKPEYFIIAKGLCKLSLRSSSQTQCTIPTPPVSFAIDNGVTVAVARTEPNTNIYINYNRWQMQASHVANELSEQLILTPKGQLHQAVALSPHTQLLCEELAMVYRLAIEDLSLNKINGAVIYISSNLCEGSFYERAALLYGLMAALLKANGLENEYSIEELRGRLMGLYQGKPGQAEIAAYAQIFGVGNKEVIIGDGIGDIETGSKRFVLVRVPPQLLPSFTSPNPPTPATKPPVQVPPVLLPFLQPPHPQLPPLPLFHTQHPEFLLLMAPSCQVADIIRKLSMQLKQLLGGHDDTSRDVLEAGRGRWGRSGEIGWVFSSGVSRGFGVLDPRDEIWFREE